MFASTRVMAIDDDRDHLAGVTNSLNGHGVACLQIHFTGDEIEIMPCPDVRIIFADLHLGGGVLGADPTTDFSVIGGLLEETIKPSGPYFILLWTMYPDRAPALREFLEERLQDVTKPFAVLPLAKADHLDDEGKVKDEGKLIGAINSLTKELPQIGALFDWERRVLEATGSTVASLLELASTAAADQRATAVGRILARLGIAAVGEDHVDGGRFRAANDALLPILADRIANLRSTEDDDEAWRAAFGVTGDTQGLSMEEAAKLNRLIHISDPDGVNGTDRGVVFQLPGWILGDFRDVFGIDECDAAVGQFRCKGYGSGDDRFRWVLVQCQAACDHAQSQPGPLPCYLGLNFLESKKNKGKKPPDAAWTSPPFEFDGEVRLLRVSARFPISLPPGQARDATPVYRLREPILNDLIYHLHDHGARPGMMSFRR